MALWFDAWDDLRLKFMLCLVRLCQFVIRGSHESIFRIPSGPPPNSSPNRVASASNHLRPRLGLLDRGNLDGRSLQFMNVWASWQHNCFRYKVSASDFSDTKLGTKPTMLTNQVMFPYICVRFVHFQSAGSVFPGSYVQCEQVLIALQCTKSSRLAVCTSCSSTYGAARRALYKVIFQVG